MSIRPEMLLYIGVMAGVTYLIRMVPLVLLKKKIENRFLLSFLYYVPYAVLSAMIIPAIFYETGSVISATVGFCVAMAVSFFEKSLPTVAACSCVSVLISELIRQYLC